MATATVSVSTKFIPAYPAGEVAAVLRDELVAAVRAQARRKGTSLPKNDDELVIAVIEIDSLTVVEILCMLDEILPFEVGECVVRPGGYTSINEAIEQVVGRVEKEWGKHHSGAKS